MTTYERIREAVSIRERLLLVLSRRQETRKPSGGGFGDRGGARGSGPPGRGMGRGGPGGAGRGFSNRIEGASANAESGSREPRSVSAARVPPVAKPMIDPDVAEALSVGAVVVQRLAESLDRVTDATKARAIIDAIPRLVPASAARLPIAAAVREVLVPLLGGRFADAADDRVAVLRLLYSEILYVLSKAPERTPFDGPGGRRGEEPRGGRGFGGRGRDGERAPRRDGPARN